MRLFLQIVIRILLTAIDRGRLVEDVGFESPRTRLLLMIESQTLRTIAGHLIPFWSVKHPVQGVVMGPWTRLGDGLQRLALDVAIKLTKMGGMEGLREAVDAAAEGGPRLYWDDAL